MDKVIVAGDVKDFPLETIIKLDANRIAAEMVHKAIDNTVWDEVSFPGIKEKLHKLVDEYKKYDEEVLRRMSPDEAASILREFTKDFEECGAWDIPKWKCDNPSMDCENCEFLKEYKREVTE